MKPQFHTSRISSALELDGAVLEIGEGLNCQHVPWDIWDTLLPLNNNKQKEGHDDLDPMTMSRPKGGESNVKNDKLLLVEKLNDFGGFQKNFYLVCTRLILLAMSVAQFVGFVWNRVIMDEKGHNRERPSDKRRNQNVGWHLRMRRRPADSMVDDYSSTEDEE